MNGERVLIVKLTADFFAHQRADGDAVCLGQPGHIPGKAFHFWSADANRRQAIETAAGRQNRLLQCNNLAAAQFIKLHTARYQQSRAWAYVGRAASSGVLTWRD